MKITGLISEERIDEHLGNLDSIDKELLKAITMKWDVKKNVQGIRWDPPTSNTKITDLNTKKHHVQASLTRGAARNTNKIRQGIGRDSKLTDATLSFQQVHNELSGNTKHPAVIINIGGKQSCLIMMTPAIDKGSKTRAYNDDKTIYTVKFTKDFMRKHYSLPLPTAATAAKIKTVQSELKDTVKLTDQSITLGAASFTGDATLMKLLQLLARANWIINLPEGEPGVKRILKDEQLPPLDVTLISFDEERQRKHDERKKARAGSIPTPRTPTHVITDRRYGRTEKVYDQYVDKLTELLKHRLNVYKNNRTPTLDSPEKILQHVLEAGYVDKIKFGDTPYNLDLDSSKIHLKDLMKGVHGRSESYVIYEKDRSAPDQTWSSPEFTAARAEIAAKVKELAVNAPEKPAHFSKEQEDWAEAWGEEKAKRHAPDIYLKHGVMPKRLKISFVLDGGKIIPSKIETDFSFL